MALEKMTVILGYLLYIDVIYLSPFPQDKDNSNLFLHLVKLGQEDDPPALQAEPTEDQMMKRAFPFLIESFAVPDHLPCLELPPLLESRKQFCVWVLQPLKAPL